MMRHYFTALCISFFCMTAFAQNGLEKLVVEKYYISDENDTTVNSLGGKLPVGSVTWRFYVDMLPGYKFQAAYGEDVAPAGPSTGDHEMRFETTTLFFNNEDRGATAPTFTYSRLDDNTVMLDSWLSAGAACDGYFGIMKSEDDGQNTVSNGDGVLQNTDVALGIPLTTEDGVIQVVNRTPEPATFVGITNEAGVFADQNDGSNGPVFATSNGSWACLNGCVGPDTTDNMVLIAQITTDGDLYYELNIQIGTPQGGVEKYVAKDPVGGEIMLPSLMDTLKASQQVANSAPTVSITNPGNNTTVTVGDPVTITASADDTDGTVDSVEFFIGNTKIAVDATFPYQTNWTSAIGTFDITAVATDNDGAQTTSAAVSITVNDTFVGINGVDALAPTVIAYPIPANDVLNIEITTSNSGNASYRLYDVSGAIVLEKDLGAVWFNYKASLDISELSSGQYFLEINVAGATTTKKVIKN